MACSAHVIHLGASGRGSEPMNAVAAVSASEESPTTARIVPAYRRLGQARPASAIRVEANVATTNSDVRS
jgi:hypothetical protein